MAKSLRAYFNGVADVLAQRAILAGDSAENGDIGANREMICREFFRHHVPKRFGIELGGDIFGIGGQRSRQIDVIINHDMSMNFAENHKIRCPVESVTAAITVKSRLTKGELLNALDNLASIPQSNPSVINLSPLKPSAVNYASVWPSLFLLAFDGIELATCVDHLRDYYSRNTVPLNRIPRSIIVNRKYQINFLSYDLADKGISGKFNTNDLKCAQLTENDRGAPLFLMMHEITKGITWLDGMYMDYGAYYTEAYGGN